jgi:DNA polymerase-3 subunit alpha
VSYCELHKHSTWSLLDGVGTAEHGARRAAELGHPALAMTEHAILSGVVHHIDACREVGITPIIGVEAYYRERRVSNTQVEAMRKRGEDVEEFYPYYHMLFLAKDIRGWRSLKLLTSEAYRTGFYRKPCIDDELLDKWNEGLFISTSCVSGFIPKAILRGDTAAVERHVAKLNRWVGDDWYWEIQPHDFDDLRVVNLEIARLGMADGHPIRVARDAHAPDPSWIETQHVSVKMRTKGSMVRETKNKGDDEKYEMTAADTAYISSAEQTLEDFKRYHPHLPESVVIEGIKQTGEVASQVVPWLMDTSSKMPRYHDTDDEDYQDLRRQVYAGLEQLGHRHNVLYTDAAEKELKIFREKRFCAFFLLLAEMIRWLRSTDPLPATPQDPDPKPKKPQKVGLGRGSAGGCVTAYATRITLINPITYDLKFERFLNPDRTGLPDVDIDLTKEGADLAKEWLKRKKGDDRVYDLISHGTMGPKAALRRVGMTYEIPHAQLNVLSKQLPDEGTLEVMLNDLPDLQKFAENHPDVWKHAVRLQGSVGTQSEHAAGVIVSDQPLDELMPVMKKSAKDDYLVTAFGNSADKEIVSDLGFLKVDLLIVVALARQAYAEDLIRRVHGVDVDLDTLPALEDPYDVDTKTMDIFTQGRIRGVFQWDGFSNMASITKQIKPESIHHLAAANAGVRPGVSRSISEYVRRRHGAEFEYWDPSVEPALAETYGLPLYQEQIMAIFQHLGGYSAAEADTVRRIMGKYYRIKGDVAARMLGAYEERFVANAASVCKGGQHVAERIWDSCGSSSEYLFNKSHADEYSLIAYGDGWLKAHYPDAFYASLLTFPPAWVKKPENRSTFYERTVREARSFGVDVLPPDVNISGEDFTIHSDAVRFGLKGIKGLGRAMVADVLNNRPFTSMEDLGARLVACNAAGRHALAQAGALDDFGARDNLTDDECSQFEEERIGVALSTPDRLGEMREDLRAIVHTQDEFDVATNGSALVVGGEVISGREVSTRKGPSLKLTVAFDADEYQVSVAPWFYDDALRELIATDEPIVVRGRKDTAWDCVSADEIKLAREVLDMMQPSNGVEMATGDPFPDQGADVTVAF